MPGPVVPAAGAVRGQHDARVPAEKLGLEVAGPPVAVTQDLIARRKAGPVLRAYDVRLGDNLAVPDAQLEVLAAAIRPFAPAADDDWVVQSRHAHLSSPNSPASARRRWRRSRRGSTRERRPACGCGAGRGGRSPRRGR